MDDQRQGAGSDLRHGGKQPCAVCGWLSTHEEGKAWQGQEPDGHEDRLRGGQGVLHVGASTHRTHEQHGVATSQGLHCPSRPGQEGPLEAAANGENSEAKAKAQARLGYSKTRAREESDGNMEWQYVEMPGRGPELVVTQTIDGLPVKVINIDQSTPGLFDRGGDDNPWLDARLAGRDPAGQVDV